MDICETLINNIPVLLLKDSTQLKKHIYSEIQFKEDAYPGPQPISIERKHMSVLKNSQYYCGHKNDGQRLLLGFTKYNGNHIAFFMSRKLDIFFINIHTTKHMFSGTYFDCELVHNQLFLFDCLQICGQDLQKKGFEERMNACDTLLSSIRSCDQLQLKKKKFVKLENFSELSSESVEDTDGYIFVPNNRCIMQGTHNTMFKWKPLYKNTIDFALMGNKCFLQNGGKLSWVKIKIDISSTDIIVPKSDHIIVEAMYVGPKSWKALHIREDKTLPNSKFTYEKTLLNLQEDIQIEEFNKVLQ